MPLLEVIPTSATRPDVTATAVAWGRAIGKTVIVVNDAPGFYVNRILAPYLNEAGALLDAGAPIESVDRAMEDFGFPVGPFTLLDEVGLDIAAKSVGNQAIAEHLAVVAKQVREGSSLGQALMERKAFPNVSVEMVEVGESTGALAEMLNSVADFYDEANETSLTRFSNLIQPVLLIVMGFVIAGLLMSLYMPLFNLSSLGRG